MVIIMKKILFLFCIGFLVGCNNQQQSSLQESINNLILLNPPSAGGSMTFYVDPIYGRMDNPGTSDFPWRTLEEVLKNRFIKTKDQTGTLINPSGIVHAGDTIILRSGYHGHVLIKNAYNDKNITIKAEEGAEARISELEIVSAKNWVFSQLIISPEFSDGKIRTNSIVSIGASGYFGKTNNIKILNSYIYSISEPEKLSKQGWLAKAKIGIMMGKDAKKIIIRNNFVSGISFGITSLAPESIIEGNVVTNFSHDGLRATASNNLFKYNIIKNNYIIDDNHPDGIQGFAYNTVDLQNVSFVGNIVLNRDKTGITFPGPLQGMGFFDGPFNDFLFQENLVMSFTWHGFSLYDSVSSKIQDNIVFTPSQNEDNIYTRMMLGTKNKGGNIDNVFIGNKAHQYIFSEDDNSVKAFNNKLKKGSRTSEAEFMTRLRLKLKDINENFGEIHELSNRNRINPEFLEYGSAILFEG